MFLFLRLNTTSEIEKRKLRKKIQIEVGLVRLLVPYATDFCSFSVLCLEAFFSSLEKFQSCQKSEGKMLVLQQVRIGNYGSKLFFVKHCKETILQSKK